MHWSSGCRPLWGALALVDPSLRELYVPLREQAMAGVDVALKVAVMARAGVSRGETADRLGISAREVCEAVEALKEVAHLIEIGERPGDGEGT